MKEKEQAESIKDKREEDGQFLRERYLSVINKYTDDNGKVLGSPQEVKNYLEACKNLAKLQHLLQPDKVTQKISDTKKKAYDTTPPKLSPALKARLEELKPHNEVE